MKAKFDASKWVKLAALKDIKANEYEKEHRPALFKVFRYGDSSIAADGFRLHSVNTVVPDAVEKGKSDPDYIAVIPRNPPYYVKVSTFALKQALTACLPFSRDASNIVRFSVNGELDINATSYEHGDCVVRIIAGDTWLQHVSKKVHYSGVGETKPIVYEHSGPDLEFALNVKYALDALQGMGDITTIKYCDGNAEVKPFTFESEVDGLERVAVLMPMHLLR